MQAGGGVERRSEFDFDGGSAVRNVHGALAGRTDPALEMEVRQNHAGGSQRRERGVQNFDALATTRKPIDSGAENAGEVELHVGKIGDQLETENVAAVFGGGAGDD